MRSPNKASHFCLRTKYMGYNETPMKGTIMTTILMIALIVVCAIAGLFVAGSIMAAIDKFV